MLVVGSEGVPLQLIINVSGKSLKLFFFFNNEILSHREKGNNVFTSYVTQVR